MTVETTNIPSSLVEFNSAKDLAGYMRRKSSSKEGLILGPIIVTGADGSKPWIAILQSNTHIIKYK